MGAPSAIRGRIVSRMTAQRVCNRLSRYDDFNDGARANVGQLNFGIVDFVMICRVRCARSVACMHVRRPIAGNTD